ncbi:MAG: glycosyltransferase, partial [Lachnospiraceae bacterium]|nr:glycosyltransferase [Lachnospiraceae bacterium]
MNKKQKEREEQILQEMPWAGRESEFAWPISDIARRPVSYRLINKRCIRRDMEVTTPLGYETTADVLVPVGENTEELKNQLEQILNTNIHVRMIFLDDCIGSREVLEYLENYCREYPESKVVHNERKIGIVSTINRGLIISRSAYVVLLGSKVSLPSQWLERLIMPMIKDLTVASV